MTAFQRQTLSILPIVGLVLALTLSGCTPQPIPSGPTGPTASDLLTMASVPNPPTLVANNDAGVAEISGSLLVQTISRFEDRRGMRPLQISAIPYLRASSAGAAFLTQSAPRALSRGEPAAMCPAAAASEEAAVTRRDAAASSLGSCLTQLRAQGADPACGCRLIAIDTALLAPQSDFSFAPVVSALLIDDDTRAERMVAEAIAADVNAELILLRDTVGERGRILLTGDTAEVLLTGEPARVLNGTRERFGYRRGRIAERLRLMDSDGKRVTLLIGVEMRDVTSP